MAHHELTTPVSEAQIRALHVDDTVTLQGTLFGIRDFGPLLVAMDSHGGSLYREVQRDSAARRAEVLASLGVKA
jgi:L(+)-tartrate dehydratase beta subunit